MLLFFALCLVTPAASHAASTFSQKCLEGTWSGTVVSNGHSFPFNFSIDVNGIVSGTTGPDIFADAVSGQLFYFATVPNPAGGTMGQYIGTMFFFGIPNTASGVFTLTVPGKDPGTPNRMTGSFNGGKLTIDASGGTACVDLPPPPPPKVPPGAGPAPDLMPQQPLIPKTIIAGQPFTFQAGIVNRGGVDAGGCSVAVFADRTTPSGSVQGADYWTMLSPIVAGGGQNIAATITYPTPGIYTLLIMADPENLLRESNRLNNALFVKVRVISPEADLTISNIETTQSNPGTDATFRITVENAGGKPALGFKVSFFSNRFSAPGASSPNDGAQSVPGLLPGGTAVLTFTLPAQSIPRGGFAWFAADLEGAINDGVRGNNASSTPWGIKNAPPSVQSGLTASKKTAVTGEPITFTFAVSDPDGDTLGIEWNFGDGTTLTDATSATHSFSVPGLYTVRVNANDGPFNYLSNSVDVEVFDSAVIDLGTVSLSSKRGRAQFTLPRVDGFPLRGNKQLIVSGTPGDKARVANNKFRSTVKEKGVFRFAVLHSNKKAAASKRVVYQFTVVD